MPLHWITVSGLEVGVFPAAELVSPGLRLYVSSRRGGTSLPPFDSLNLGEGLGDGAGNVRSNRRTLLNALGMSPRRLARGEQVHGARIEIVRRGGLYRGVDGLVTGVKGLTLAVSTADCFPVIVHSPSEGVLAALHVGRTGAAGGIIPGALRVLVERFAIDPGRAVVFIGPGICARCYEIGAREAESFPPEVLRVGRGRIRLDLAALCRRRLREGGVPSSNIHESGLCTACDPHLFFSYRRDGGRTGRHWTLAAMNPPRRAR